PRITGGSRPGAKGKPPRGPGWSVRTCTRRFGPPSRVPDEPKVSPRDGRGDQPAGRGVRPPRRRRLVPRAAAWLVARDPRPDPDRAGPRLPHQVVPGPGVLHPVRLDDPDARDRRPGPRREADLPVPRPAARRDRR